MTGITRQLAEEAWRDNPPSAEHMEMMRFGGDYRVAVMLPVSPYVGSYLGKTLDAAEPVPAPYSRFRMLRTGPTHYRIVANDKWSVASGHLS
jgi:hypothetical protein